MRPVGKAISAGANKTLLDPQIGTHFSFLEGELAKRDWFAGPEFTAADIQMSFPIEAAAARAPIVRQMPRLSAFLQRIQARPADKRAVRAGAARTNFPMMIIGKIMALPGFVAEVTLLEIPVVGAPAVHRRSNPDLQ